LVDSRNETVRPWIVGPWFDLFFFANCLWPLALLPGMVSASGVSHVSFWQVYFLTTPHRWLTLFLVASDPDRREGRTTVFVLIAAVAALVVVGAWTLTGAFTCIALIDYVWNAWHFAAQHGGILRIYSKRSRSGLRWLETWGTRIFIAYVGLRLAGWTTGWTEVSPLAQSLIRSADLILLAIPLSLLGVELVNNPLRRLAKLAYIVSVMSLYSILLLAVRDAQHGIVIALTAASAAFHAIEYLAIVTYYAAQRQGQGSGALFQRMAKRWTEVLLLFMVVLGVVATIADSTAIEFWLGINLWAAFLHYAYDGMIWKLRHPATSRVLVGES
jgi:hypothetical protein